MTENLPYFGARPMGGRDGKATTLAEVYALLPWNVARPATLSVAA